MTQPQPFTASRFRIAFAGALFTAFGVMIAFVLSAPNANAQQVDCEQVNYNDAIVLDCETNGTRGGGTPAPTATPRPAGGGDDTDDGQAGNGADGNDDGDRIGAGGNNGRIDRGDRGSRTGADLPDIVIRSDTDEADDDDEAEEEVVDVSGDDHDDDLREDGDVSDDSAADSGDDESSTSSTGAQGEFIGPVDPVRDTRPVVVALVAVLGVGAALFVAAWRTARNTDPF